MFACCHYYFRLPSSLISIHTTCISLSLRRTSAPIHLRSVLGVLGTQVTSCILIAELLERDIFDLYLPEFDKPWVIHLKETCCCSTNLCTWRPNTVYKSRSICRHQCISQGLKQLIETLVLDRVKDLETIERAQLMAQELDASKKELEVAYASLNKD